MTASSRLPVGREYLPAQPSPRPPPAPHPHQDREALTVAREEGC